MPILPPEPDLFPEHLLDSEACEEGISRRWWACYTLSRREKELMRRLRAMGVPHYGPLVKRRTRSAGGRPRVAHVPLFSGYVFIRATDEQRYEALTTNCISRTLEVPDGRRLLMDLRQIRRMIASGEPLTPEARLEPGMRVRVRGGPLEGIEGVVVERRGQQRLLVAVEFLQQGASVSLEDYLVERIA